MPWVAWRWTVCPAPFLPQLVPARQQHCRGRPLATSYQGHAGSWAASGHGKRYSCRHIYSFIVYLRFFPSLPSFTKGERDKKTIYQLFHFVCVCFATHKYASECKRCIVCRGVYLMLGSGMVCSMYPQPSAWRPSLPCLAQWAATAVTGPQRRQQQQTTAPTAAMFCCCGCCAGCGDQRLGRWPLCLSATDCFLVPLQLVLYTYWVTGLLSSKTKCI